MSPAAPGVGEKAAKGKIKYVEIRRELEGNGNLFRGTDVETYQSKRGGLRLFTKSLWKLLCFHQHPAEFLEIISPAYW